MPELHPIVSELSAEDRRAAYALFVALPLRNTPERVEAARKQYFKSHADGIPQLRLYTYRDGTTGCCCPLGAVNLLFLSRDKKIARKLGYWRAEPGQVLLYPSGFWELVFPNPVEADPDRGALTSFISWFAKECQTEADVAAALGVEL